MKEYEKKELNEVETKEVVGGTGKQMEDLEKKLEKMTKKSTKELRYSREGYECFHCKMKCKGKPLAYMFDDLDKPICRMCIEHFDNGHFGPPITNF